MSDATSGSKLWALLGLVRVSNLPTVWMNVAAAAALSGATFAPGDLALVALSMSALYTFGMALNDLFDREVDAVDQPYRPIPAGRVSVAEARATAAILLVLGFAPLFFVAHPGAVGVACLLVTAIVAYDWIHKRTAASVFLMASCRLLVFAVTGAALAGSVGPWVIAGGVSCFVYTLAITVVARHENQRGARYSFPLIPRMIAGMAVADGAFAALAVGPLWIVPGVVAAGLTHLGQRYVRGD